MPRRLALLAGSAFIFFILASAPHAVHHVFEQHHAVPSCPIYSLVKGCSLAPIGVISAPAPVAIIEFVAPAPVVGKARTLPTPFSSRAPPAA
jgi:hypothetical protein